MSKEIDLIKCIISEIDNSLYSDFGANPCISYTSNLKKLLLALDTPEVRHFFENYEQQAERIAELEEQLKNARKETAKKVIDRVEELGVFDFEAYEEMDFRRYIISEMALDNILKEYGE